MKARRLVLVLWLGACGGDDDDDRASALDGSVKDASIDARVDAAPSIDARVRACDPIVACQGGAPTTLPELCTSSSGSPAGDRWRICVVDPSGRAAFIELLTDQLVTSSGWTHSNYGDIDSTLSEAGEQACLAERALQRQASQGDAPDAGNQICYR